MESSKNIFDEHVSVNKSEVSANKKQNKTFFLRTKAIARRYVTSEVNESRYGKLCHTNLFSLSIESMYETTSLKFIESISPLKLRYKLYH